MNLSPEELNTILAALRFYQSDGAASAEDIDDLATNGGAASPLDSPQIDALCERLNSDWSRGRPPLHADKKHDLRALRDQGVTIREITEQLGMSRTTAYRWLRRS